MGKVLNILMNTSIISSLLILITFAIRSVFKNKINPKLQYALWVIVAVRLLIPFNFQWTVEIKSILPQNHILNLAFQDNSGFYEENEKEKGDKTVDNKVNLSDFSGSYAGKNNISRLSSGGIYRPLADTGVRNYSEPTNNQSADYKWNLSDILFVIWIVGIFSILFIFGTRNISFYKKSMRNMKPYDFSDNVYDEASKIVDLKGKIPVYLSQNLVSPCVMGIVNPAIILTEGVIHDSKATKFALIHEMIHYKQKDNFIRLLENILCALYWFNPLVWLSAEAARNDAELSCDSRVLDRISSKDYFNYCFTILSISDNSNRIVAAMSDGGKKIKRRIDMIIKPPQKRSAAIIAAVICLSLGISSFVNINVKVENLSAIQTSDVISLGNIYEVYQLLTRLPNSNDNYKINSISINTKDDNGCNGGQSLYLGYEFSEKNSIGGLNDDDVKKINANALHLFSSIPDLKNITISYIDKPANSIIRNIKSPVTYTYDRDKIEKHGDSVSIVPEVDVSFWQSWGGNNVIIVDGYSDIYSKIGIKEEEYKEEKYKEEKYKENPAMVGKLLSKLGNYSDSWKNHKSTIYRFSPNPVYPDWKDLMIMTDEFGNLESHGIILSDSE
ncbi:M56 family metallopeptidase [Sporanaerobacter sp. PP17-6a]|uniref:M56 family metallopeptidase n=1 Tax=Sporanaerobacter sp. PP17-6a TaxID=1891289 RepID=UPI00089FD5E1|nr:M56 family metallopeptidase [Sporanaerobacter sp. PP17-6a]SCL97317.1 Regulatory protein BlaR1 [Sporanaerobacter sp. PP17-6a]